MNRETVIAKVKVCMDELTPFSEELVLSNTNSYQKPIDAYIDELVDKSCDVMQMILPDHILPKVKFGSYDPVFFSVSNNIGVLPVPDKFLRLAYLKIPEWENPVYRENRKDSRVGRMQENVHLRGGYVKPVAIIDTAPSGKVLKCYTVSNTEHDTSLIECEMITSRPAEELSNKAIEFVAWKTAEDVFMAMGENNYAKGAAAKLKELIEVYV